MYTLVQFLIKQGYTLCFLCLFSFSTFLIVQGNNFHNASFFSAYHGVAAGYYSMTTEASSYLNLRRVNNQLLLENKSLRQSLNSSKRLLDSSAQFSSGEKHQKYTYTTAKVVDFSLNRNTNYIIINKGSNQGVQKEMGVITSEGLVGVVKDVTGNYASVISLLNKGKLSFYGILPNTGYSGRVNWASNNPYELSMYEVPKKSYVSIGDPVLTGRESSVFPEGIPIGSIIDVQNPEGEIFYQLKVQPKVDFAKLNHVYVITNLYKEEQDSLKNTFIQTFN